MQPTEACFSTAATSHSFIYPNHRLERSIALALISTESSIPKLKISAVRCANVTELLAELHYLSSCPTLRKCDARQCIRLSHSSNILAPVSASLACSAIQIPTLQRLRLAPFRVLAAYLRTNIVYNLLQCAPENLRGHLDHPITFYNTRGHSGDCIGMAVVMRDIPTRPVPISPHHHWKEEIRNVDFCAAIDP